MKSNEPFAFAGLWEVDADRKTGDPVRTFAIRTCKPNILINPIYDRMPCILRRDNEKAWMKGEDMTGLCKALEPYPADELEAYPVSRRVNFVAEDDEALIESERA